MAKKPLIQPGSGRRTKGQPQSYGFQGGDKPHAGALNQKRKAAEKAAVARGLAVGGKSSKILNED